MATKLQRAQAHARMAHDADVRKSQATGSGQRLGGTRTHRSTPPQQDTEFAEILRQQSNTPPVHAKILPWVSGIETEGYQAPEGMFGPYDSQPPTRVQSIHDTPTAPAQRSAHPFAYNATLPYPALAGDSTENLADVRQRPESEVMSRGAGLRYFTRPKDATPGAGLVGGGGQETPMSDISPNMGTFGMQPSQENLPLPSVLTKAMPNRKPVPRFGPPAGPLPSTPQPPPKVQTETPQSTLLADPPHPFVNMPVGQHVHHSHPEYPFDPIEASRKQEEAMHHARAQALAALESVQKHSSAGQAKGPRGTMETMTSDPSFGHLFHKDGAPMSRHMSMDTPMPILAPPPVQTGKQGMFGGGFYRIPFGVPMAVHLPRPLLVSRNSAGLGVGVGLPSRLAEMFTPNALSRVAESPESRQRKARSAYVETVQDEQEPVDPTVSARHARSGAPTRSVEESAALPESGIQPHNGDQETIRQATVVDDERAPSRASVQAPPPPPKSPSINPQYRQSTAALPVPEVPTQTSHMATQGSITPGILRSPQRPEQLLTPIPALGTAFNSHPETRNVSLSSQMPTVGTASPAPIQQELEVDDHSTITPTTASNVKDIVQNSRFHDETLCQLLDAARLNLVGSEAKKALNRAARERVAELRALRDRGELTEEVIIPVPGRKGRERKSKDSKGKRSKKRSSVGHERQGSVEPSPPQWAQEIIQRLSAFDNRFAELEKQGHEHDDVPSQDFAGDLIDNLLFNELNLSGIPAGLPGMSSMPIHLQAALGYPGGFGPSPVHSGTVTPRGGARLSSLSPDKTAAHGELISWGSEVELPPPGERVTPPKTPRAPVINIQAPTESNIEKSQRAITPTQGTRTPKANTVLSPTAPDIDTSPDYTVGMPMSHGHPVAMPDPSERNLPATPTEGIKSHRASPAAPHKVPLPPSIPSTGHVASPSSPPTGHQMPHVPNVGPTIPPPQSYISHHSLPPGVQPPTFPFRISQHGMPTIPPPQTFSGTAHTHNGTDIDRSQTAYKTAYEVPSKTPDRSVRDRIHVNDPMALGEDPTPWGLVTQRLYSWALVWDEKSFVNALEEISLGRQVDEFALSIFVMMTFKRMLRRNMSESPVRACDKLFVPPTMAKAINQAVHSKNFKAGQQMLEELWYPFLFKDPPRIIIALSRHRNEPDQWTTHRYDLSTGSLRSYAITHEDKQLKDGRPFMWWHAIRLAWPQYNIPDPATLSQRLEKVHTLSENKDDNSLEALNYARNMFVGYRPERSTDLTKLRENVWGEVKRLLQKKRGGHLVVDLDSPTHVDDL